MATSSAGAISVLISADTASFDSSMSKVGAMAERELKRVEKAQLTAKNEGERFIAMVKKQADTFGLTGTALLAYEARIKGVAAQTQPYIDKLNQMKAAQDAVNASVRGIGAGEGIKANAHEMEGFSFATAGAKRELLVLAHELSQGNYSRFGGSMLVLGERTGAAALLFSGMGIAVLGTLAALGAFAAAAVHGAKESDALAKSLVLTGNFSGTTADEFQSNAERIAKANTRSVGSIKDIQQALIETGRFGPREMDAATEAVAKMEKTSGKSAGEIVKDFEKMQDGVVKWAEEHNKSMHFITAAQLEHVRQLDETGKHEEAVALVLDDLNKHLNTTASFWDKLKLATSQAWDEMAGTGRAETVGERLAGVNARIAEIDKQNRFRANSPAFSSAPGNGKSEAERGLLVEERRGFLMDQLRQKEKAVGDAETARVQQAGIAANQRTKQILGEIKGQEGLQRSIEKAKRDFADAAAAGTPVSAQDQASVLAELRKKQMGKEKPAAPQEWLGAFSSGQEQYKNDFLRTEIASYKELAAAESKAAEQAKKEDDDAKARAATLQKELNRRLADMEIGTAAEIAQLEEETKYLGLNTLGRRIAVAQIKEEAQARKLLEAFPGNEKDIDASAARRKAATEASMRKQDAAQKSFSYGADRAFRQYEENAANAAKHAEQFVSGSLQRTEDALVNFVKTGKLNLSSLFTYMADEFLRNQIRMQIAKFSPGGSGGGFASIVGAIGGLFGLGGGGGSAVVDSSGTNLFADAPHLSEGTNYVPYDGMPAVLHKGEAVVPAAYNNAGGGGQVIHFDFSGGVTNVGQGVSRGEVSAAVQQGNAQTEARIRRLMRNGNVG